MTSQARRYRAEQRSRYTADMIALMLLAGCGGCLAERPLLPVSDCSDASWNAHHSFYDKRTFAWRLSCPGGSSQGGEFRVGAVLRTEKLPQFTTGVPCSIRLHEQCPEQATGMGSGLLYRSGERPAAAVYRYRCGDEEAALALWFTAPEGEIRCDQTGACFAADAAAAPSPCALELTVVEPG